LLFHVILRKSIYWKCFYIEPKRIEKIPGSYKEIPIDFGFCNCKKYNLPGASHHALSHGNMQELYL